MIERHRVNIFYTAPTAIRAFIKWGEQWPLKHDLSSLRLLGTVGEPINPEAWMWYRGDDRQRSVVRSSTRGGKPKPARS
jgi:acetyl-CoA synthetase